MKTIHFEDHGQDFTEWDIDADGHVIDCRPFQAWVWCKCRVLNPHLAAGDLVEIRRGDGVETYMNYPAARVVERPAELKVFCLVNSEGLSGEEWYVGESREQVLAFVRGELGNLWREETDDLEELTGSDLDRLKVTVEIDEPDAQAVERSFRAHLDREIAAGGHFPRHFASSNY